MVSLSENIRRAAFWEAWREYFAVSQRAFLNHIYDSQFNITGVDILDMHCNQDTADYLTEHPYYGVIYNIKNMLDPHPYILNIDESIPDYHVGIKGLSFYFDFHEFHRAFLKNKGFG